MGESGRVQDALRRALRGEAWHGPSLVEALAEVDAELAGRRAPGASHTIAELACHLASWARIAAARLRGGHAGEVPDGVDWPAVRRLDAEAWTRLRRDVESAYDELIAAAGATTEADWDAPAAGDRWTRYALAHGVAQHTAYHAGQVRLLRRLLAAGGR